MFTNKFFAGIFLLFCMSMLIGCSQSDQALTGPRELSNALDADETTSNEQIESANAAGIDLSGSQGIFSIGWREIMRPNDQTAITDGNAMAVAFDTTKPKGPKHGKGGLDMGSVYINYGSNHLELNKRVGPKGGVGYSSKSDPRSETNANISFVSGGSYEFEITGSAKFAGFKASVTAPSALLAISSHTNDQAINVNSNLTLTWSGGNSGNMMIRIHALKGKPEGGPRPGGGGPGAVGQGGGHKPDPRLDGGIVIKLESNSGEYTITSAQLKEVLKNSRAGRVGISVVQVEKSDVPHGDGTVAHVLENADMVALKTQQ